MLGKITVAIGMVTLALVNRYHVGPRVRAAAAIADFKRPTIPELALAGSVRALISLFGLLDPM